jgi:hypothetical protein
VEMDPAKIEKESRDLGVAYNATVLKDLCHEMVHSTNRTFVRGWNEYSHGKVDAYDRVSGYQKISKERHGKKEVTDRLFTMFDEGVTEKLARELAIKYMEQEKVLGKTDFLKSEEIDQATNTFSKTFLYKLDGNLSTGAFIEDLAVDLVNAFIAKVSREAGVPQKMVWESIIRGQYEGEDMDSFETKQLLAETVSPGFAERLRDADTDQKLLDLVNELKQISRPKREELKKRGLVSRVMKWLRPEIDSGSDYKK